MTNQTVRRYDFTAFLESDLLGSRNGTSIGVGDVITMPAGATTCFTVKDDDSKLSGDACRDERADDGRYQTADVIVGDQKICDDVRIYAESQYTVRGSDGRTYTLVEIELQGGDAPGTGDDFFTFYGDVPPAGTTLTIVGTCGVGGNGLDYRCLDAGEKRAPDEPEAPIAATDDHVTVCETEAAGDLDGNVLTNDDLPEGAPATVVAINGVSAGIGQWVDLAGGGRVKLNADGSFDFDADGDFDALTAGQIAETGFNYTVQTAPATPPSLQVVFTDRASGLDALVTVTEQNGKLVVKVEVLTDGGAIGDIRGLFFDVKDEALLHGLRVAGADVTDARFAANAVDDLGNGANVSGSLVQTLGKFDAGVEIGSPGLGSDDIRTTTFTLSHTGQALTLDFLKNQDFGLRLTSVGPERGCRDDSLKLGAKSTLIAEEPSEATADVVIKVTGKDDPLGALSGRYFCDENGNAADDGEPGIAGKLVTLLAADGLTVIATTTTAADGGYRFDDLPAGDYVVMFESSLPEKAFIQPDQGSDATDSDVIDPAAGKTAVVTVVAGEETTDVDAGVATVDPMTGEIGDTVWLDSFGDGILNDGALDPDFSGVEPGVPGVTVQLKDAATGQVIAEQITDANGQYLFTGLAGGAYVVAFVAPAGFAFTAQDAGGNDARDSDADAITGETAVITLAPGGSIRTVDAGLLRTGLIEGSSQADPNSPVGGYDLLVGAGTDDTIIGRSGEDTLIGKGGDDRLEGDSFDDLLLGGEGNDQLFGGSENDVLVGGAGNDLIDGDQEWDVAVFAGARADAVIQVLNLFTGELLVTSADGTDLVREVEVLRFDDGDVAVDALLPGGSRDQVAAPVPGGAVVVDVLANDIEIGEGTLFVAEANRGGFGSVAINPDGTITYTAEAGFAGYDFFTYTVSNGVGFSRTVEVQVGELPRPNAADPGVIEIADRRGAAIVSFDGTAGNDAMLGGSGYDRLNGLGGGDVIDGGRGNDQLIGGNGDDLMLGGDGDDRVQGDGGSDRGFGEVGDDSVGGQIGNDFLFGGEGRDVIDGLEGSDFMAGGAGDDTFREFRTGSDIAFGGAGNDRFLFVEQRVAGERDLIDGESGIDRLTLTLAAGTDAAAVQAEINAYLAIVAANAPAGGSITDGSVLTGTFSFTAIDLDIRNVEEVLLG